MAVAKLLHPLYAVWMPSMQSNHISRPWCTSCCGQAVKLQFSALVQCCAPAAQVRDFLFSPDDGRISQLIIDALGIPALPERLLGCLGVRIQLVNSISFNCVSLQPGAEVYIDKISPGAFDGAVDLLKVWHIRPTLISTIWWIALFAVTCPMCPYCVFLAMHLDSLHTCIYLLCVRLVEDLVDMLSS